MQVFDYNEFSKDMAKAFDTAQADGVIINYKDGNSYKLLPIKNSAEKIPFEDIPSINANISMKEIVEILRESRA